MSAPAAPATSVAQHHRLQDLITELHARHTSLTDGHVATYIPELGKANPEHFGVCVVTAEGEVLSAGDCDQPFTIQSISKPFTFGMALEELGRETVSRYVGVEPSGDAFNSIWLHGGTNRPVQPDGQHRRHCRHRAAAPPLRRSGVRASFSTASARWPAAVSSVDAAVYESERRTGHRNRAIAHLLLNFDLVHDQAEAALDVYFRQCSILVTCRDLATMAATLANMGRNPITGQHALLDMSIIKDVLSVMFTCGMYDYSGQWAYRVGVPAKSGVSGGVMAVVNRQLGIASYSPRLDAQGNSSRGIEVCVDLAARLGLHVFDCLNVGSSFLSSTG